MAKKDSNAQAKKDVQPVEETAAEQQAAEEKAEEEQTPQEPVETAVEEENPPDANLADFQEFDEAHNFNEDSLTKLDYLNDLQLNIYIELGRTQMKIKDILELERGYVIELDKLASEPVDIFVNNKKIAEGEVVVIDKHFGIRIVNLVDTKKMVQGLT